MEEIPQDVHNADRIATELTQARRNLATTPDINRVKKIALENGAFELEEQARKDYELLGDEEFLSRRDKVLTLARNNPLLWDAIKEPGINTEADEWANTPEGSEAVSEIRGALGDVQTLWSYFYNEGAPNSRGQSGQIYRMQRENLDKPFFLG